MKIEGDAKLVTIYVGASDTWHGQNLATAIVLRARELGIAGATVVRGIEGFGATSRVHTARILRLSEDLPVKVEIVDLAERIEKLLPLLDEMVTEGLVTVQDVHVARYVHDPKARAHES
jgi:PII-like signaling protein